MTHKIVFVGAAGSGKSTLVSEVYTTLKKGGVNAELLHEFVRSDIQRYGPMTSVWEQYRTRMHQATLEDAVPASVEVAVTDSGTLSPYFYTALYCDPTQARQRLVLHDMHAMLIDDLFLNRYDHIFFLPRMRGTVTADGTRYQTEAELDMLDDHMRLVFTRMYRLANAHLVDGPFDGRLNQVMDRLG